MSELLRATIALQDDSIHMLEAENKRLTAELETLKAAFDECYQELIDTDLGSQKFEAKVEQLERLYLRDVGSCEPLHLAAAIGNKPCVICGANSWVKAALKGGDKDDGKD